MFIVATNGSDILKGMRGSDQLRTYGGDDLLLGCDPLNGRGAGEVDQMTGDGGADIFVLGDAEGGSTMTAIPPPRATMATRGSPTSIRPQDKLKLFGSSYLLGPSPISGVNGSALFHDSNGNGTLDATDELIATLGTAVITAANTLAQPEPVTPPTIESAGVTEFSMSLAGTAPALSRSITFSMNQSLRPGVTLELLASSDLGSQDPWRVIASKTGDSVWHAPAGSTLTAPSGGKVNATITIPSLPGFYKLQVRGL